MFVGHWQCQWKRQVSYNWRSDVIPAATREENRSRRATGGKATAARSTRSGGRGTNLIGPARLREFNIEFVLVARPEGLEAFRHGSLQVR